MCFIPQEGNFTRYFTGFGTIFNKPCVFYSLSLLVSFILSRLSCAGGGGVGYPLLVGAPIWGFPVQKYIGMPFS